MSVIIKENENIDDLQCNGLKIIQNDKYFKYGIDAVLLTNFAKSIRNNSKVVEFGTGTGVIPILLTAKVNVDKIYALEIQKHIAEMAERSVELNNLNKKIEILNIDLKNVDNFFEMGSIHAIVTNPPYQKENSGIQNECEEKRISRHEVFCNIGDICEKASYLLKDKGELYMVHRPERLVDIICNLRKYKLEPKVLRYVQPNVISKPNLILIKAVKNGNVFLKTLEPLIVYEKNGEYTNEIKEIYGM